MSVAPADAGEFLLVYVATPSLADSEHLAELAVEQPLAACANILPTMNSIYAWNGEIKKEAESLLLLKTSREKFSHLQSLLLKHHPYECPAIVAISLSEALPDYLRWLANSINPI